MSKESKSKVKTGVSMEKFMSAMKKSLKFYDNKHRIEKLEIEVTELREVLSLNK